MTRSANNTNDARDSARLARIDAYAVIGQPPLPELEALVGLAAQICDVPRASINLLANTRQQVATVGREPSGESQDAPFDDAEDLVAPDGVVVGSLSVQDTRVRSLTLDHRRALRTLADRVVDALEHRLSSRLLVTALAELAAEREETRRSTERIATFADQVSHDLRNPLTAVSMSLQMLAEQPSVTADDDAARMVARALNGTRLIDSLIEKLLVSANDAGGAGPA